MQADLFNTYFEHMYYNKIKRLKNLQSLKTLSSSTPIPDLVTSPPVHTAWSPAPDNKFVDVVKVRVKEFKEPKESEKPYCICRQPSYGPMIYCEGEVSTARSALFTLKERGLSCFVKKKIMLIL